MLISDLFEGGIEGQLVRRVAELVRDGVTVVGAAGPGRLRGPSYDHEHAAALAALGVPTFACTPDQFPELLSVAISGGDIGLWAAQTAAAEQSPGPRTRA